MRCLFVGTPDVAAQVLESLLDSEHEVVGVLTREDARSGRGRRLVASPVAQLAESRQIPVWKANRVRDPQLLEQLQQTGARVAVVVAYGALLPPSALSIFEFGWINIHFSLLPDLRGAAPVQRALQRGDEVAGCSIFQIEEDLDSGPVYAQSKLAITPSDTAGSLLSRLGQASVPVLEDVLDQLESGSAVPKPQSEDGVTLAPKLRESDRMIDFADGSVAVVRRVAAVTPDPGAFTFRGPQRLKLGAVQVASNSGLPDCASVMPGQIHATKKAVYVATLDGWVELGEVAPPGKKMMRAADWARGAHLMDGERLGAVVPESADPNREGQ